MAIQTKRFINSTKNCSCNMTGVWRACAYCEGVVIVFHSPRACAHVARRMDLSGFYYGLGNGIREELPLVPLLSTEMEDKHSIFGGGERLEDCLRFAVEKYHPECIMVASSCVAGVIGDDVPAICETMEEELKVPILSIDSYGFMDGEYFQGYYYTAKVFAERFMEPCAKEPQSFLLLGDAGGPWGEYASFVRKLLEGLGLKYIGQFPGYLPFKEIKKLGRAQYLVPLGRFGKTEAFLREFAEFLSVKFNMEFVPDMFPLGLDNTKAWLHTWCELVGKQELENKLLHLEDQRLKKALEQYLPVTKDKKVVLCLGRSLEYFHPQETLEMLRLLEVDLEAVILLDAYNSKEKQEMEDVVKGPVQCPVLSQGEAEAEKILKETELVLTTHELKLGYKKQIFIPMVPRVGINGLLAFMEVIYRLLCSRIENGGTTYVRG